MKKKKGKRRKGSGLILGHILQSKRDNFNRDRSPKTPDEFADDILKDMKPADIYSEVAPCCDGELDVRG